MDSPSGPAKAGRPGVGPRKMVAGLPGHHVLEVPPILSRGRLSLRHGKAGRLMTGPPTPKVPTNDTIFLGARTSSEQQRSDCSDTPAARIALTGQPASWHPANSLNYLDRQSIDYRGCSQGVAFLVLGPEQTGPKGGTSNWRQKLHGCNFCRTPDKCHAAGRSGERLLPFEGSI